MKRSNMVKWGLATAALVSLGMAALGSASAAEDDDQGEDDQGLEGTGIRHGIRYEGCNHFELVGPDAVEAWGHNNAWRFAKWLPKLDQLRANPEPAIIEAMELLFPECSWPPPVSTTFAPERLSWADAMAAATEAVQTLDLDASAGVDQGPYGIAGSVVGRVLAFGLRAQPLARSRRR